MTVIDPPAVTASRASAIADMSAREIAARIAGRELSSADAVEHFIARLNAVNGKLNAVTTDLSERRERRPPPSTRRGCAARNFGPLAGLPVTIKECFDLAGTASTFGLSTRRNEIERRTIRMSQRCAPPAPSPSPRPIFRS